MTHFHIFIYMGLIYFSYYTLIFSCFLPFCLNSHFSTPSLMAPLSPKSWHKCFAGPRYLKPFRTSKNIVLLAAPIIKKKIVRRTSYHTASKLVDIPLFKQTPHSKFNNLIKLKVQPSMKKKKALFVKEKEAITPKKNKAPAMKKNEVVLYKATPPRPPIWSMWD